MPAKRTIALRFVVAFLLCHSHGMQAQGITLSEKNASVQQVFHAVEKQTNYLFWYEYPLLNVAPSYTINHVLQVDDQIFQGAGCCKIVQRGVTL